MSLSTFLENQVSAVLRPKVPPISSPEHKVWKGATSPFCLFKCVANGASYIFYTSFARCEIQEEWMFQGFLVLLGWESVSVIYWSIAICIAYPSARSAAEKVLMVFYLFVFMFYCSDAICKNGNYSYKTGVGVGLFPGRWHISQQKEKGMLHQACWQWSKPAPVCLLSQPKQNAASA